MSWLEIRLDTTHEAIDWVCTLLGEAIDPQNFQITNYLEADPPKSDQSPIANPSPWAFTMLLYFPEDGRSRHRLNSLEQTLSSLHRTELISEMQVAIVPEKPQLSSSFQQPIGKKFSIVAGGLAGAQLVKPLEQLETERIPLHLNPSFAFGSGLHPATVVSLHMLERYVLPGMNTLDLGSGSGILSVAMAKLGAKVLALDNDPIAVQATQEAIDLNQVQSQVIVQAGSLGGGSNLGHWLGGTMTAEVSTIAGNFDLVMANIFARIHIALAEDYYQALKQEVGLSRGFNSRHSKEYTNGHQGILITAGFTTDREEEVTLACQGAGFTLLDCWEQYPWVSLVFQS